MKFEGGGYLKLGKYGLKPKQERCVELMVLGTMTQREIAREIGVTPATICNWRHNRDFVEAYNEALRESVRDMASVALKTMTELLESGSPMVRCMAARDILDRSGVRVRDAAGVVTAPVVVISGADQLLD